jgi:hypothetical protein
MMTPTREEKQAAAAELRAFVRRISGDTIDHAALSLVGASEDEIAAGVLEFARLMEKSLADVGRKDCVSFSIGHVFGEVICERVKELASMPGGRA